MRKASKKPKSRALSRLQESEPDWPVEISPGGRTIFGRKGEVWFERLIRATFRSDEEFRENYCFLCRAYAHLLEELKRHLEVRWPAIWQSRFFDPGQTTVLGTDAEGSQAPRMLQRTLNWLRSQAEKEERLRSRRGEADSLPAWNRKILSAERLVELGPDPTGRWLESQEFVETACNPAVLEKEIARLAAARVAA